MSVGRHLLPNFNPVISSTSAPILCGNSWQLVIPRGGGRQSRPRTEARSHERQTIPDGSVSCRRDPTNREAQRAG